MHASKLIHVQGDIFSAPPGSILLHACNTLGSWGAGIAAAFKERYPQQFSQYHAHCKAHGESLLGTCMLIKGQEHDIACLFTSKAYGKRVDKPPSILTATRAAVQDLMKQNLEGKEIHAW